MSRFTDRIDMRFQYTPASKTDIRKTWAKERKRLAKVKAAQDAEAAAGKIEVEAKVRRIKGA